MIPQSVLSHCIRGNVYTFYDNNTFKNMTFANNNICDVNCCLKYFFSKKILYESVEHLQAQSAMAKI